jgi:hypothetical protein
MDLDALRVTHWHQTEQTGSQRFMLRCSSSKKGWEEEGLFSELMYGMKDLVALPAAAVPGVVYGPLYLIKQCVYVADGLSLWCGGLSGAIHFQIEPLVVDAAAPS